MGLDQTNRYLDLDVDEQQLIAGGNHVLVAYKMKPAMGFSFLSTASHFAAESSTGTNVETFTTDEFTKSFDTIVYSVDEANLDMRIAFPVELFDVNMTDGHAMLVSMLVLIVGVNQGMSDVEYSQVYDFYVPPKFLKLFDGPAMGIADLWRVLGRSDVDGGFIAGTIVKPKLGLRPERFADAAYQFWLGGDYIKNDEPQGNQSFCPMKKVLPLVADAMQRAQDETGVAKIFSVNISADDHYEMLARADYALQTFAQNSSHVTFLVDGFAGGPGMVTTARRQYPGQFLHYHRAGHAMITSSYSNRGYTMFVLAKMVRLQGVSGLHAGTMGYGKMDGSPADKIIFAMLERDECQGPVYYQTWEGMKPTTCVVSGGMNALRLPVLLNELGHGNLISTAGGGCFGHLDSPTAGAKSLRQAFECWQKGADPIEFAEQNREFARAFESFPEDADRLYPGWRNKLGIVA